MKCKVKYFDEFMPPLEITEKGDWIDLRVRDVKTLCKHRITVDGTDIYEPMRINQSPNGRFRYHDGEMILVTLGVAIELEKGYKANIYPRSSLFKNHGLLLTNSVGCIDNSYNGDNDEWCVMLYATRDGILETHERIVQFDVVKINKVELETVPSLGNDDRGGYGTSGRQ